MTYVDRLIEALKQQLRHPWRADKSGGERVWFLVFDPTRIRTVLAHKEAFRLTTEEAGKRWVEIDISQAFGRWIAGQRYADRYYARPALADTLYDDFANALAGDITQQIADQTVDGNTLLVMTGTEALFGITRLSHITRLLEDAIPGRLLIFFPGEYREPQYRFLDARDGWNYLAIPILPVGGGA